MSVSMEIVLRAVDNGKPVCFKHAVERATKGESIEMDIQSTSNFSPFCRDCANE